MRIPTGGVAVFRRLVSACVVSNTWRMQACCNPEGALGPHSRGAYRDMFPSVLAVRVCSVSAWYSWWLRCLLQGPTETSSPVRVAVQPAELSLAPV